jgi:uncharacterized damage-inducible protein DinB
MTLSPVELQKRLQHFTEKSLEWCAKESEQSTAKVTDAVDQLLNNTARVSQLSHESLQAIESLQKTIKFEYLENEDPSLEKVIASLQELSKQHTDIQEIVDPIIRSLQFQDRLRQNLENMVKMLNLWLQWRSEFQKEDHQLTADDMRQFGKALLEQTTMQAEREVIRQYIDDLPEEPAAQPVNLF